MAQQQTPAPANPAEAYERHFVPALAAPWAEDLLGRAAPQPGECVLDVACGTGIVARLAAPRVGPTGVVIGVDPNPGMLGVARAAAAAEGLAIDWREGRGEALPVDDAAFDLVCCQQGLQFFEDRAAGLREMRRVLASDGRVAVSVGKRSSTIPSTPPSTRSPRAIWARPSLRGLSSASAMQTSYGCCWRGPGSEAWSSSHSQ